jgi:hypothetical protein
VARYRRGKVAVGGNGRLTRMRMVGHFVWKWISVALRGSVYLFHVAGLPGLVEECLLRAVEP